MRFVPVNPSLSFSLFAAGAFAVMASQALADAPASTNSAPATPPASATPATPPAPAKPKVVRVRAAPVPFYRDTTEYPPLRLTWNTDTDLNQVLAVFTHPLLPQRAVVTTQTGLLFTDDAGRTWTNLPEAAADKVGVIKDVVFHPVAPDTLFLASATSGIWMTTDQGKTFTQIGSKARGLASDTVTSLLIYSGDPAHQTLLAVHGDAAPGLSCSRDGGQTWEVMNTDYHFRCLAGSQGDSANFCLTGSTLKEPDIESLYTCNAIGEYVVEAVRDVVPTDMAFAPVPFERFEALYLATSDSGLYRVDVPDRFGQSDPPQQIGSKDDNWASVAVTWGSSPDAQNLCLYDTAKRGLVISGDDLATTQTASDGLPVSSLMREGALIRPNANGTVFYTAANGTLSIGRPTDDVPVVEINPNYFEVLPARSQTSWEALDKALLNFSNARGDTLAAAQALCQELGDPAALYHQNSITITARLPLKPAPPKSVTVDLTRYGGGPDMPLFDDGRHNDGTAGDGVYGGTFAFLPEMHRPRGGDKETRSVWPGRVALGVRATFADGHHQGAVGVVSIYSQIVDLTYWNSNPKSVAVATQGPATAEAEPDPAQTPKSPAILHAETQPGSWSVKMKVPYDKRDITGYAAVSFWIKAGDGSPPKELYVQLADDPVLSATTVTPRVPILNGKSLGADYLHVVIPLSQLLDPVPQFQSNQFAQVILAGDTTAPAGLIIANLQLLARYDEPPPAPANPTSQ